MTKENLRYILIMLRIKQFIILFIIYLTMKFNLWQALNRKRFQ
ncbi:MAG: hypothetical protein ANABAC_2309 [Anaerolineae bacterium]|nr:MAG: hypothetical protein ANABAC_2309 [Anaerolineae bacterium]